MRSRELFRSADLIFVISMYECRFPYGYCVLVCKHYVFVDRWFYCAVIPVITPVGKKAGLHEGFIRLGDS